MAKPHHDLALLLGVLGPGLLSAACIITTTPPEDDDGADSADGPTPTTGAPSDDTNPTPDPDTSATDPTTPLDDTGTTGLDDTGDTTSDTTGGPMGDCTSNLLGDPGFEAGTPNPSWDEASMVFGTPICDASCTNELGAGPYAGDWWVWLGGLDDEPEVGSVGQVVTIDPETAYLGFWFQIRSGAGTGDDIFAVTIDDQTVFMAVDSQMSEYEEYTQVYVDISEFADGGEHEVVFTGDITGNGLTSFFVDETSLVSCVEEGTGSSSSGIGDSTGSGSSDSSSSGSGSGSSGSSGSSSGTR